VLGIGLVNYSYKFSVAIILTPLLYLAHNTIDKYLGPGLATELKLKAMNSEKVKESGE
jgi:queuosine precursor transporter